MASSDPESVELKEQHVYGYVGMVMAHWQLLTQSQWRRKSHMYTGMWGGCWPRVCGVERATCIRVCGVQWVKMARVSGVRWHHTVNCWPRPECVERRGQHLEWMKRQPDEKCFFWDLHHKMPCTRSPGWPKTTLFQYRFSLIFFLIFFFFLNRVFTRQWHPWFWWELSHPCY